MAKSALGKPPDPRTSDKTADPTTEMFSRWMRETEAIDTESTGKATQNVAPHHHGRRLLGIALAGVVVAGTVATFLWPDQLLQLIPGSSVSQSGLTSQRAQSGSSSDAASALPAAPAASAVPGAPAGNDPASVADALTPARASAGRQLTENSALTVNSRAETLLVDGQVDARLILVLGVLLSDHTLTIADFPQGDGGAANLRNSVVITELDGADLVTDAQAQVDATSLLLAFTAPAAPSQVKITGDGILARIDGPEPPGLLPTPAASLAPAAP